MSFEHSRNGCCFRVSHWRKNDQDQIVACDAKNAEKARLEAFGGYPYFEYTLPDQQHILADHERFLARAYEAGRESLRREFRLFIGAAK